jgi:FkbM family methyltransferase
MPPPVVEAEDRRRSSPRSSGSRIRSARRPAAQREESNVINTTKSLLHRTGFFPVARRLYLSISRAQRRERELRHRFFAQFLQAGDLCFDIGAHLGQSIEAFRQCGARVVAVEPNALCLPTLFYAFSRDPNVIVVNKAVGASPGTARLHFHEADSTATCREDWFEETDGVSWPHSNGSIVKVEVITLQRLIDQYGVPRLLKVEVQGFEEEVFAGLDRPVPIIYFEMFGADFDAVRRILARIERLGEVEGVNVSSKDHSRWLLDRWMSAAEFVAAPSPAPGFANVVVRMR